VYGLLWSPFDTNVFLSCSADWSIRLWHQDRTQPVINLFSSTVSNIYSQWIRRTQFCSLALTWHCNHLMLPYCSCNDEIIIIYKKKRRLLYARVSIPCLNQVELAQWGHSCSTRPMPLLKTRLLNYRINIIMNNYYTQFFSLYLSNLICSEKHLNFELCFAVLYLNLALLNIFEFVNTRKIIQRWKNIILANII